MNENHIFIIILIVLVLISCISFKNDSSESFTGYHNWGYQQPGCKTVSQSNIYNPTSRNIVGPDPSKNEINNWQYNPQNTLVDYKYYKDNQDLNYALQYNNEPAMNSGENRSYQQLAPIIDSQLGKTTYPEISVIPQPNPQLSTRVPNAQSTYQNIIFPSNPSTSSPFNGPHVKYQYNNM